MKVKTLSLIFLHLIIMMHDSLNFSTRRLRQISRATAALCGVSLCLATAAWGNITIRDVQVSPNQAREGDTVVIRYDIETNEARDVILKGFLYRGGGSQPYYAMEDYGNERTVALQAGRHTYERQFFINPAPDVPAGAYNLQATAELPGQGTAGRGYIVRDNAFTLIAPNPLTVPILSFNKIGEKVNWFWISTETFDNQMRALKEAGYTTVSLQDVMDYRRGRKQPPEKPIVLTFLNGWRLHKDVVDPILAKYGFKATNFIPPHHIGGNNSWDPYDNVPLIPHLTWDEIRAMEATGRWDFQATGNEHTDLRLTSPAIESRLAKERIEQELGKTPRFFSYPYGTGTDSLDIRKAIWRQGYEAAFGFREGYLSLDDRYAFPRFDMHHSVHTDRYRNPEEWYLFGSHYLGSGTAMPKPHFEYDWDNYQPPYPAPWGTEDGVPPPPPSPTAPHHPADSNQDWVISINEVTAYGAAWRQGTSWGDGPSPITIDYVTRAGFLWRNGGAYRHESAGSGPSAWVPDPR
jgi:peptidoglycan/xylan/chitin deacetylase (PgdA/CDA1 family)